MLLYYCSGGGIKDRLSQWGPDRGPFTLWLHRQRVHRGDRMWQDWDPLDHRCPARTTSQLHLAWLQHHATRRLTGRQDQPQLSCLRHHQGWYDNLMVMPDMLTPDIALVLFRFMCTCEYISYIITCKMYSGQQTNCFRQKQAQPDHRYLPTV